MRYVWPFLIETSSSPSTRGPGVPARRSCSRMYCCSSAFTVGPVESQLLGHIPDRGRPTAPSHVEGEALGVKGIVREKREALLLHRATAPTGHAPHLDVEVDAQVPACEIAHSALFAVVPAALHPAVGPAGRFFDRRVSVMIRAWGSPKIPVTVGLGRNPGKRYASHSRRGRRGVGMRRSCPIPASPPQRFRPLPERLSPPSVPSFHPLTSTKTPFSRRTPRRTGARRRRRSGGCTARPARARSPAHALARPPKARARTGTRRRSRRHERSCSHRP